MKPERSSLRGLLAWLSGALLAALVLYAAGAGPASYYETRYQNSLGNQGSGALVATMGKMYRPLEAGAAGTSLQGSLAGYRQWWSQRAAKRYPPPVFTYESYNDPGICYGLLKPD